VLTGWADYFELYETSWLRLRKATPQLPTHDYAMYSAWNISYGHIKREDEKPQSCSSRSGLRAKRQLQSQHCSRCPLLRVLSSPQWYCAGAHYQSYFGQHYDY
jgi:hypothetical protein